MKNYAEANKIHPAGGAQLGRMMGQSLKSATGQMKAFNNVQRLMDDGVDGILRFCDDLGGEIRSLEGGGQQEACPIWNGSKKCSKLGGFLKQLCSEASDLFRDSRQLHEQAVQKVKHVLVNFQQTFVNQSGLSTAGAGWEPFTQYLEQHVAQHGSIGRARLLAQLLEPPFEGPVQDGGDSPRLADL